MKKQVLILSLSVLSVAMLAGGAFAGTKTEEIQGRQDIQNSQIQQGVDNGELTQRQIHKLIKGQERINKKAHAVNADDKMTRREFHKLEKMQNKESKAINKDINTDQKYN